jgi:threonine dehydrogenase-like Zn-dependent dehydrogenase
MALARSLWFQDAGLAVILEKELPEVKEGWCLVETLFSAISPGTERLVFIGRVPEELHEEMKYSYMEGEFSFPVKYGYSLVGRIVEGPQERIGQIVHVLHPHQDRCVVKEDDTFLVPNDVPPKRATLASNLEAAVNAVWDSQVTVGERILVVGFGIIGSLVARLISFMPGVEVEITDTHAFKKALVEKMGFKTRKPEDIPGFFDLAINSSGNSDGLQLALDKVGIEGRVVELSWYGTQKVSLSLGGSFHPLRKKIISSQVSSIPSQHRPRWDLKRRKSLVFKLLQKKEFDSHITHSYRFEDLPGAFDQLKNPPTEGLSYLVTY